MMRTCDYSFIKSKNVLSLVDGAYRHVIDNNHLPYMSMPTENTLQKYSTWNDTCTCAHIKYTHSTHIHTYAYIHTYVPTLTLKALIFLGTSPATEVMSLVSFYILWRHASSDYAEVSCKEIGSHAVHIRSTSHLHGRCIPGLEAVGGAFGVARAEGRGIMIWLQMTNSPPNKSAPINGERGIGRCTEKDGEGYK